MLYACPRSSFIDFDPNNSAGFGGIGPHAKKLRLSIDVVCTHFSKRSLYVNTFVSPKYYLLGTFDASPAYAYQHQLIILSFLVEQTQLPY